MTVLLRPRCKDQPWPGEPRSCEDSLDRFKVGTGSEVAHGFNYLAGLPIHDQLVPLFGGGVQAVFQASQTNGCREN